MPSPHKRAKWLAQAVEEAQDALEKLERDPGGTPDYALLHRCLTNLEHCCSASQTPSDIVRLVARLYFETKQYQQAAVLLRRLRGHTIPDLLAQADFYSAYYAEPWDWAARQEAFWSIFRDAMPTLSLENMGELRKSLDHLLPSEFFDIIPGERGESGTVFLGVSDGVYSLFPMNYLFRHAPKDLPGPMGVSLDAPPIALESILFEGRRLPLEEVLVHITPAPGYLPESKVDLELWHPVLQDMMEEDPDWLAQTAAEHLVCITLPTEQFTLCVNHISVAEQPLDEDEEDTIALDELESWLEDEDIGPGIRLDRLLRYRVFSFTREPVMVSRPRGDITRGETCMPELEEIYFLRDGKGLSTFQRYGVGHWFLIVPRKVCGEDFPAFRDALIKAVLEQEKDTICFTGWAEGTRNWYLDFLSLSNLSALRTLQRYLQDLPGGKDVRISTFYWNAVPRTVDAPKELEKQAQAVAQIRQDPEAAAPPKEQVSKKSRAALEKAFRETQWEKQEGEADWAVEVVSPYEHATDLLRATSLYIVSCDRSDAPYDYSILQAAIQQILPQDDAPDADNFFCVQLSTLLLVLGRHQESAKWMARVQDDDSKAARLYACEIGSSLPADHQWEDRRQAFWKQFAAAEQDIAASITGGGDSTVLHEYNLLADLAFPYHEAVLFHPQGGGRNALLTGLPGGILTLPAMLYLVRHYPANIARRWDINVSWDGAPWESVPILDQKISTRDVQVSLRDQAGTVSLALWHPYLTELTQEGQAAAQAAAVRLVNTALPMGARLLYVEAISVAAEAPEDAFPLPELRSQMRERGYLPDIPLDTLLSRRRYTITREGKYNGRPRSDILRGETCMPELERIYFRLSEEGQVTLERHGIYAAFLMIPNQVCQGDPARYRQQVQRYLTQAEGDKVFFTGWAEGTEYCYLDLISMHGTELLDRLNEYALSNPGGRDLRFSSFYWNCRPLHWISEDNADLSTDSPDKFVSFAKAHLSPDFPAPDVAAAAELEMSFQPLFAPEDFCAPEPPEAPAPAPQRPAAGKKKLSKAQRKAQNSQNTKNNQKNNNGKSGKKKR